MLRLVLLTIWHILTQRSGREPSALPTDFWDYAVPPPPSGQLGPDDIPVAQTPPGGYKTFPPRVLARCGEPPIPSAPDLRGVWQVHAGLLKGHVERVEQCGDRVVITANGVIHDMRADGSLDRGVRDIAKLTSEPIAVAAEFKNGRLDLRPRGGRIVAVSRWREGDEMVWRYGIFINRLHRLQSPGTNC